MAVVESRSWILSTTGFSMNGMMNYRRPDKVLFDSDELLISQQGDLICLDSFVPWSKEHAKLARKYGVNCLQANEICFGERNTAEFLFDIPLLQKVHIVVPRPMDLSAVSQLTALEHLAIMGDLAPAEREDESPSVDLTPLTRLRRVYMEFGRPLESVLTCASIESMWLWNGEGLARLEINLQGLPALRELELTRWPRLKSLDLTAQPNLERLHMQALPKLRPGSVTLHSQAALKSLKIGGCGPYRIDWARIGNSLEELELLGPLRFPFEDVLKAPNLRKLYTTSVNKFPPLKFLLGLKQLRKFSYFSPPPGPRFSPEDDAVIRKINGTEVV
jgi:hypothetical protein